MRGEVSMRKIRDFLEMPFERHLPQRAIVHSPWLSQGTVNANLRRPVVPVWTGRCRPIRTTGGCRRGTGEGRYRTGQRRTATCGGRPVTVLVIAARAVKTIAVVQIEGALGVIIGLMISKPIPS